MNFLDDPLFGFALLLITCGWAVVIFEWLRNGGNDD